MQTKENLTLRASAFGSKCELSVPYMDKVTKSGLADSILSFAEFKSQKELKKNDGTKRSRLLGERRAAQAAGADACACACTGGACCKQAAPLAGITDITRHPAASAHSS